ncbi:30S ribosomal protein S9 [Candidatus Carsonella ruddii]|uniref:Small ribosomal subunit protein uS9 n=1 Tax=Candidatus Carsonella ruddii CE isolate Thao2000 TaxID=1202536 RepID=J7GY85_CARRU|nr:30S ribosomal protein S9 [Candidatus Carsonella ruddii]AFP83528.1 ribosomal protein S9 [Candidatus Carsonella ruddii CE isolate Thao2000]
MIYISYSKKKKSYAKVLIKNGNGKIFLNNTTIKKYFGKLNNINNLLLPLIISNIHNNIIIFVSGGGKCSQINSIKISLCKCISLLNYNNLKIFRKLNLISIDDRKVERKIFGRKKSRKKEQYSKR